MNTFQGTNLEFPNRGLHFLLAEVIKFRKQLTKRSEFKSQSGWNDALNHYMYKEIENCGNTLELITYYPDPETQEELEAQARDTTRSLADDASERDVSSDNVLMPVSTTRPIVWDLSGSDPDIPQITPVMMPNDFGRAFITLLDIFFVELTRLDSRFQPSSITTYESVMMRSLLNEMFSILQRKGGEFNKSDIPTGTLNVDEPNTFQG